LAGLPLTEFIKYILNIRQQQNEFSEYLTRDGRVLFCSVSLQVSVDLGLDVIMLFCHVLTAERVACVT